MATIYKVQIDEFNGEREHTHDIYVVANSQTEAEEWALAYAAGFYEEAERTDVGDEGICWQIEGGAVLWCLHNVTPDDKLLVYDTRDGLQTARLVLDKADFFPTPPDVVRALCDSAAAHPGMRVLDEG